MATVFQGALQSLQSRAPAALHILQGWFLYTPRPLHDLQLSLTRPAPPRTIT